jgi:hypothetical protein
VSCALVPRHIEIPRELIGAPWSTRTDLEERQQLSVRAFQLIDRSSDRPRCAIDHLVEAFPGLGSHSRRGITTRAFPIEDDHLRLSGAIFFMPQSGVATVS